MSSYLAAAGSGRGRREGGGGAATAALHADEGVGKAGLAVRQAEVASRIGGTAPPISTCELNAAQPPFSAAPGLPSAALTPTAALEHRITPFRNMRMLEGRLPYRHMGGTCKH